MDQVEEEEEGQVKLLLDKTGHGGSTVSETLELLTKICCNESILRDCNQLLKNYTLLISQKAHSLQSRKKQIHLDADQNNNNNNCRS